MIFTPSFYYPEKECNSTGWLGAFCGFRELVVVEDRACDAEIGAPLCALYSKSTQSFGARIQNTGSNQAFSLAKTVTLCVFFFLPVFTIGERCDAARTRQPVFISEFRPKQVSGVSESIETKKGLGTSLGIWLFRLVENVAVKRG